MPKDEGHRRVIYHMTRWALITVFCPEMMMVIAAEQWRTVQHSIEDFQGLLEQTMASLEANGRRKEDDRLDIAL